MHHPCRFAVFEGELGNRKKLGFVSGVGATNIQKQERQENGKATLVMHEIILLTNADRHERPVYVIKDFRGDRIRQ